MEDIAKQKMNREDYPHLYRVADSLSIKHQKRHFRLLFGYLMLLLLGATISFIAANTTLKVIAIIIFVASSGLYFISKLLNPMSLWYNGRAVAESVKTMTWKWMMCASPYQTERLANPSDPFIENLQELFKENKTLFKYYHDGNENNDDDCLYCISDKMRLIRRGSSSQKLEFYNKQRVEEQSKWYKKKAKYNHTKYIIFSSATGACYIIIIALMIIDITNPSKWFPVEILSVLIASLISWIEAKQYNELASSYSLTVSDISLIKKDKLEGQVGVDIVCDYVINSETAFSREHTQWIARKNNN